MEVDEQLKMGKPSILFRADGNAQIGLGHVMRSLALAQMLSDDFDRRFAIHLPSPELTAMLLNKGIPVVVLPTGGVSEFLSTLNANDIVVLDGYFFDEVFQKAVKNKVGKLVFIDDLVQGHQVADVLINHTAGIPVSEYDAEPYTRFLLGPDYALVNPRFQPQPLSMSTPTIFVNLGGADPMNISHDLVSWLVATHPDRLVRVALGGANQHRLSFAQFPDSQVTVLSGLSVVKMVEEITRCQLALVSCSTVAYEVATVGRPFIGILTADNQARLARFFTDNQLALGVLTLPLDLAQLSALLIRPNPETSIEQQRRYLDGRAAERLRRVFRELATP